MKSLAEVKADLGVLEQDGEITVERLASTISQRAVLVDLRLCGGSRYVSLPKSKEKVSEESSTFLSDHFTNGRFSLLSKETIREFTKIKNDTRNALYRASAIRNGNLIPVDSFRSFKSAFDENKEKFEALRDDVLSNYDFIKQDFDNKISRYLAEAYSQKTEDEIARMRKGILKEIPSKEVFRTDFLFSMKVLVLPSSTGMIFEEDLQENVMESLRENSLDIVEGAVSKSLSSIFSTIAPFTRDLEFSDGSIERAIGNIKNVGRGNFLESKKVSGVVENALKALKNSSRFDIAEKAEKVIAEIYMYFKEKNNVSFLTIPKYMSKEYLDRLEKVFR